MFLCMPGCLTICEPCLCTRMKVVIACNTINIAAKEYLQAIDPVMWAVAYFPITRYGHLTQNIAESVNAILKNDHTLSITDLLDAIGHQVMADRASRFAEANKQAVGMQKGFCHIGSSR